MISSKVAQVVVTCQGLVMGSAFRSNDTAGLRTGSLALLIENLRVLGHGDDVEVLCFDERHRSLIVESWWLSIDGDHLNVMLEA